MPTREISPGAESSTGGAGGLMRFRGSIFDSDIANARRFAQQHGDSICFTNERGWLVWDGRRWAPDEKALRVQSLAIATAEDIFDEIKNSTDREAMMRHAKRSQSKRSVEAMIHLARSEHPITARLATFDTNPWLLNVANGTLDLRVGELQPHQREDYLTKLTPIAYDKDASCDLWNAFLGRVTGGCDDLYRYMQRMVGYLLTGETSEQVLHFLFGLGANGKSVFCEIIGELLGEYAIIASPEMLMARHQSGIPNDVARLRGARVALMNETSQGARFDEAKLKDLTGSDSLTARFLHAEFFDFRPTHKLIIRGNHKPTITGMDEGIWRRLRLIPFTVPIPTADQDKRLLEKLKAELPGILRWAVCGAKEWQRDGLRPPALVSEAIQEYRAESDTLGRFIEEHCEVGRLAQVKSSAFFMAYRAYCERSGERGLTSKELPAEMQRRGYEYKRTASARLFLGVQLESDPSGWNDGG